MAGKNVVGSHKEMTAVINNLKESRVLSKTVQTLSMEESYSTKLLDLNSKIIKYQFSRLKSSVGKIKSHLQSEEIATLRLLELEGKFKPVSPILSLSSTGKIAAASRRLKLNEYRRAKSAAPRLHGSEVSDEELSEESEGLEETEEEDEKVSLKLRMKRKVSRGSLMSNPQEVAYTLCPKVRPHSSAYTSLTTPHEAPTGQSNPPTTAQILEKITSAQKARKNLKSVTAYSCHDGKNNDSTHSNPTTGIFGLNLYEARRKSYLEAEHTLSKQLTLRKKAFLNDTAKFVEENPSISDLRPEYTSELIQAIDSMAGRPESRSRNSRSAKSIIDRLDSELLRQFNELRKTRYLRIDESLIDYSGVNTLVKDQFNRTQSWRNITNKNRVSFKDATAL